MSMVVIALMILGLAAAVAYPFFATAEHESASAENADTRDMLEREKGIALLAIREADLDRAMGKLSEDDYGTLRLQYEERAVHALAALDELGARSSAATSAPPAGGMPNTARFCVACGRGFQLEERFCPACGRGRTALA